jgi:hypothetical protein
LSAIDELVAGDSIINKITIDRSKLGDLNVANYITTNHAI